MINASTVDFAQLQQPRISRPCGVFYGATSAVRAAFFGAQNTVAAYYTDLCYRLCYAWILGWLDHIGSVAESRRPRFSKRRQVRDIVFGMVTKSALR